MKTVHKRMFRSVAGQNMEHKILKFIEENNMLNKGDKVIVGVSGGADSVCLLFVLNKLREILGISIIVVHVHHGLRGEEADMDARYVEQLCSKLQLKCVTEYIDVKTFAGEEHLSIEEAARILRYKVFQKKAQLYNCNKTAVAHHSDDQAETVLFQAFRGSGLRGLAGMESVRGNIIRPLLGVTRMEIEHYLAENNIRYCTDSTNLGTDYSRNKMRNYLLPYIKENINAQAVSHLCSMAEDVRLANSYIEKKAYEAYEKYVIYNHNNVSDAEGIGNINIGQNVNNITKQVKIKTDIFLEDKIIADYVFRICIRKVSNSLKDITRRHINSINSLSNCSGYKEISLPYNVFVSKSYDELIFSKRNKSDYENKAILNSCPCNEAVNDAKSDDIYILIKKEDIQASENGLSFVENGLKIVLKIYDRKKIENIEKKAYTKYLDCDKIKDIFALRYRQPGDYVVVNEHGGRKKIKDYFIDMKIPKNLRDEQLLVADGSHIVWVVGYRISEDVKITKETIRVLEIDVKPV